MSGKTRLPRERQDVIHRLLRSKRFASVRELASTTNVSSMTIRRDLEALEAAGVVNRVFGGAQMIDPPVPEQVYGERLGQNRRAKEQIAARAASLVVDGDTVALDGSTTAVYLARELKHRPITVVTNGLLAANELAGGAASVFLPGGTLRSATHTLAGEIAQRTLADLNAGRVFFSVSGLRAESGWSDSNAEEIAIKRALFAIAESRVALVDASKFGRSSLHNLLAMDEVQLLITDAAPDARLRRALERAGVGVCVADA